MLTDFEAFRPGDAFPRHLLHVNIRADGEELGILRPFVAFRWRGELNFCFAGMTEGEPAFSGIGRYGSGSGLPLVPQRDKTAVFHSNPRFFCEELARALIAYRRWPRPPHPVRSILYALRKQWGHGDVARAVRDAAVGDAIRAPRARGYL